MSGCEKSQEWTLTLTEWFREHARDLPWRHTRDPYAVWVSEIMLQQTRVEAVREYYRRFLTAYPTVEALACAEEEELFKLWEGLGYYSRARNLKKAAVTVTERYGGKLPSRYEELLTLSGIGPYTAGAIASIAFGEAVPAVDGNVLRVMARLETNPMDIADPAAAKAVRARLLSLMPKENPGAFNQALMELGATVCLPNGEPLCERCPLSETCLAYRENKTGAYPVRSPKKKRRIEGKTVFALMMDGALLLHQRPDTGLLASLWQLPEAEGVLTPEEAAAWLGERGLYPTGEWRFYDRKHVFTHVEWHMRVCALSVSADKLPEGWVADGENRYPLPTAYRVCLS